MGNFGICRVDLMKGLPYHYDIDTPIENGVLAEVDYATGKIKATTDVTKKQVLVASVANLYNSLDESDFRNEVGAIKPRTYEFEKGNFFTTTQIAFGADRANIGAVVKGDYAYATVGGKLTVASTFPSTGSIPVQKFRVEEKTQLNGKDALVLKVELA
ncbi:hypothetical protein [Metabacillus fastidiosus]|uniref:hypothetical protein n=1 Tax=Metabacillus fastidiosus TaxID=1458 RepID=UPI003D27773D